MSSMLEGLNAIFETKYWKRAPIQSELNWMPLCWDGTLLVMNDLSSIFQESELAFPLLDTSLEVYNDCL